MPHTFWFPFAVGLLAGLLLGVSLPTLRHLRMRLQRSGLDPEVLGDFQNSQLFDRALTHCDEVLARRPGDVEARFQRGVALAQLERYDEALREFLALQAADPADPRYGHQAAYCLLRSEMPHSSLGEMDRVLALGVRDTNFLLSRADVLLELDRAEEALALFRQTPLPEEDAEGQIASAWGQASCHAQLGDLPQAIRQYRQALDLGCEDPECRLLLARALEETDRKQEALDELMRQLLLTPDYAPAYLQTAKLLLAMGEPKQALSYLEQGSTRSGDAYLYEKAQCLAAMEQPEEAIRCLRTLLDQQGDMLRALLDSRKAEDFPALAEDPAFRKLLETE